MEIITTLLLLLGAIILLILGIIIGRKITRLEHESVLPGIIERERQDATKRSRSVLGGLFSEQLAPYLPGFKYSPTEVRFLGKPIDFIVFKGMDEKIIEEVVFVEVKSGKSKLSGQERNLKEAIDNKRVKYEEYRIPEK